MLVYGTLCCPIYCVCILFQHLKLGHLTDQDFQECLIERFNGRQIVMHVKVYESFHKPYLVWTTVYTKLNGFKNPPTYYSIVVNPPLYGMWLIACTLYVSHSIKG